MRRVWILGIIAAALALWLWRVPTRSVVENENGEANHSTAPGYVASGAELIDTNAEGQPEFRMVAERIEQPWPAADVELTSPQFSYAGETAWTLTAQRGVAVADPHRLPRRGSAGEAPRYQRRRGHGLGPQPAVDLRPACRYQGGPPATHIADPWRIPAPMMRAQSARIRP